MEHVEAQLAGALRYEKKVSGFIPSGVIGPVVGWASNRSEYQEYFLGGGVKAAGAWGWQAYHLRVPVVMKSGSVNLLEPSGPFRVCKRTALPFALLGFY